MHMYRLVHRSMYVLHSLSDLRVLWINPHYIVRVYCFVFINSVMFLNSYMFVPPYYIATLGLDDPVNTERHLLHSHVGLDDPMNTERHLLHIL